MLFSDIAAEDCHTAHTDAECKERLVHGCLNCLKCAVLLHSFKVRQEIKRQAGASALHKDGMDREQQHNRKQRRHHELRYALEAALQSET